MASPADDRTVTVVLVAHGSRAPEANRVHLELAAALDARVGPTVVGAFMELGAPSIGDAIGTAADGGASVVAVVPYFLHPGRHDQSDIPRLVAEVAGLHPEVDIRLLDRFGADPALLDVLTTQIDRALG